MNRDPYKPRGPAKLRRALKTKHPGLAALEGRTTMASIRNHAAGRNSPDLPTALAYERHLGIKARHWLSEEGQRFWGLDPSPVPPEAS